MNDLILIGIVLALLCVLTRKKRKPAREPEDSEQFENAAAEAAPPRTVAEEMRRVVERLQRGE